MASTTDERVLSLRFDNSKFESKAKKTLGTINKINSSLNILGTANIFLNIEKQIAKVSLSPLLQSTQQVSKGFSTLEIAAITAISNITSAAINAGAQITKSLTLDQLTEGWSKFEQKVTATQTIVAAGYDTSEVEKALEKLMWFTDETSYSFSDMAENIGKFTAMGTDLEEATNAMMGISNWAAVSGQGVTQASMAMYNLAQAMGMGAVKLQDWRSIENANMGTKAFKEQVIETAKALGTLDSEGYVIDSLGNRVSKIAVSYTNFREMLETGFFTSDVLLKTLNTYSDFTNEVYELSQAAGISAAQAMEQLDDAAKNAGESIDSIGEKAFKAAQEAKTLTDALNYAKDAISSTWMKIYTNIFGNYEEAKSFWTDFCDYLWRTFAAPVDKINSLLNEWGKQESIDSSGKVWTQREKLITAIQNTIEKAVRWIEIMRDVWADVFPTKTANELSNIVNVFYDWSNSIQFTNKTTAEFKEKIKNVLIVIKSVKENVLKLVDGMKPLKDAFNYIGESIAKVITYFSKTSDEGTKILSPIDKISSKLKIATTIIANLAGSLKNKIVPILKVINKYGSEGVAYGFYTIATSIKQVIEQIISEFTGINLSGSGLSKFFDGIISTIANVIKNIKKIANTIFSYLKRIYNAFAPILFKVINGIIGRAPLILGIIVRIYEVTAPYIEALTSLVIGNFSHIIQIIESIASAVFGLATPIVNVVRLIADAFKNVFSIGAEDRLGSSIAFMINKLSYLLVNLLSNKKVLSIIYSIAKGLFTILKFGISIIEKLIKYSSVVIEKIKSIAKSLLQVALYISKGLIGGIHNVISDVVNVVNDMIESVKKALGIHSPSKVFMWIGAMIAAGLAIGFIKAINGSYDLYSVIKDTVQKIISIIGSVVSWIEKSGIVKSIANIISTVITAISGLITRMKDVGVLDAILNSLASSFYILMQILPMALSAILAVFESLSKTSILDYALNFFNKLSVILMQVLNIVESVLSKVDPEKFGAMLLTLLNSIAYILSTIAKILEVIFSTIDIEKAANAIQKIAAAFLFLALAFAATKIIEVIKEKVSALVNLFSSLANVFRSFSGILNSVKDAIDDLSKGLKVDSFKKILGAIAALFLSFAVSIYLIKKSDVDVGTAMFGLISTIIVVIALLEHFMKMMNTYSKSGIKKKAVESMTLAIYVFSMALKKIVNAISLAIIAIGLAGLSTTEILSTFAGLSIILASIFGLMKIMIAQSKTFGTGKKAISNFMKTVGMFAIIGGVLATSLISFAIAMSIMPDESSWENFGMACAAMGVTIGLLSVSMLIFIGLAKLAEKVSLGVGVVLAALLGLSVIGAIISSVIITFIKSGVSDKFAVVMQNVVDGFKVFSQLAPIMKDVGGWLALAGLEFVLIAFGMSQLAVALVMMDFAGALAKGIKFDNVVSLLDQVAEIASKKGGYWALAGLEFTLLSFGMSQLAVAMAMMTGAAALAKLVDWEMMFGESGVLSTIADNVSRTGGWLALAGVVYTSLALGASQLAVAIAMMTGAVALAGLVDFNIIFGESGVLFAFSNSLKMFGWAMVGCFAVFTLLSLGMTPLAVAMAMMAGVSALAKIVDYGLLFGPDGVLSTMADCLRNNGWALAGCSLVFTLLSIGLIALSSGLLALGLVAKFFDLSTIIDSLIKFGTNSGNMALLGLSLITLSIGIAALAGSALLFAGSVALIGYAINSFIAAFEWMKTNLVVPIQNVISIIVKKFESIKTSIENLNILGWIKDFGSKMVSNLKDGVINSWNTAKDIGKNIVDGLKEGISSSWDTAKDTVVDAATNVKDWFCKVLGIHSPSTVFEEIGIWIMKGLGIGVEEGSDKVEDEINEIAENTEESFWDKIKNFFSDIGSWIKNGISKIKGIFSGETSVTSLLGLDNLTGSLNIDMSSVNDQISGMTANINTDSIIGSVDTSLEGFSTGIDLSGFEDIGTSYDYSNILDEIAESTASTAVSTANTSNNTDTLADATESSTIEATSGLSTTTSSRLASATASAVNRNIEAHQQQKATDNATLTKILGEMSGGDSFQNTFNITSSDPKAVAQEVSDIIARQAKRKEAAWA